MKNFILILSMLITVNVFGARPPGCTDIPISMTFVAPATAPAAIWNDDPTKAYRDGVDSVSSVIHLNSKCDGTRDATLTLYKSKRYLFMQFPNPIPGSIIDSGPPSFAGGSPLYTQAHINVHNLLGYPVLTPGVAGSFYTKVGASGFASGTLLRMLPDDVSCPTGATCVPNLEGGENVIINQPTESAWAKVNYTPRDRSRPWSMSNTDTWVVEGEYVAEGDTYVQRSTLLVNGVHFGQYSMPFKILISALASLP